MNKRYDKYLVAKYAPLYRDRFGDMRTTAMCWGFEVGDGWFNIINTLSMLLCSDWIWAKQDYDAIKDLEGKLRYDDAPEAPYNKIVTAEMIAEKKAEMDAEEDKIPVVLQVKEKFGGLRFYVTGATDEQYAYIRFAEAMSYKTCEVCGKPGKVNRDGWIKTRCQEHMDD